ncbi:MAG: M50 family metallopeptidase [Acidimicrobiales bacterium]
MTFTFTKPEPADPTPVEEAPRVDRGGLVRLAMLVAVIAFIGVRGGFDWLVIVGAIVVMIFLHELGHFLTAKWSGMKVTQFFLGFGPRIWSFQRGETEYGIKAIPAGAYVKVIGMYGIDDVDPDDEGRTYRQKKYHQRVIMASAGSATHFLLALGLIFGVLVGIGTQQIDTWQVGAVAPGSGAEAAGLQPGDRLVSVDGVAVTRWDNMRGAVAPRRNQTVPLVIERANQTLTLQATIGTNPERPADGQLGVEPAFPYQRMSPLAAVPETGRVFGGVVVPSVQGLGKLFSPSGLSAFAAQVVEGKPDSGEVQTAEQVATDNENRLISIYGAASLGVDLMGEGLAPTLLFIAMLNIFIGLFNLVPLLPFDGGHIAIATYERLQELRKRNGRRHFTDVNRLLPLTYAVVALVMALGLASIYLDIVKPVSL